MSFWSCVRTHHQRETFAAERLHERGFETLLPRVRKGKSSSPLFGGYLFALVVDRWREIESTFGVLRLVKFGDMPARVPDREVEALRSRMGEDGLIVLPKPSQRRFAAGDRVRILSGGLVGFEALHTGQTRRQREIILISMLGSSREVEVPTHLVAPL